MIKIDQNQSISTPIYLKEKREVKRAAGRRFKSIVNEINSGDVEKGQKW